ncbi:toprim domain-containing protein [uncultured Deefgea sp.]|uniref:toprim domain-containing protein n=1 Tax=uncultured Deefgea sp. TaxID=1304914 RepID=UPI0026080846|nr:toprim domain-containing protein [uncultured Deefgea sp.]
MNSNTQPRGKVTQRFSLEIKQAARGLWPHILQTMGIPAKTLDGRNHPCPACGGTDRFQFTVRGTAAPYGRFACRGLDKQGGDGFALVMHVFNLSFPEAVQAVANVLGLGSHRVTLTLPKQIEAAPIPQINHSEKLQRLFDAGDDIGMHNTAGRYLYQRGIREDLINRTTQLRYCDVLDYWHVVDGKPQRLASGEALIARIQKPCGALAGLHRIYLDVDANKLALLYGDNNEVLPAKKLQTAHDGALAGAACRLRPLTGEGRLALTEGIETALAVHQLTGLPVWACISASGLKTVQLPDTAREVFIYGDNDQPDHKGRNAGAEAAYILATRLLDEGRKVKVILPPQAGTDWLDVLNNNKTEAKHND